MLFGYDAGGLRGCLREIRKRLLRRKRPLEAARGLRRGRGHFLGALAGDSSWKKGNVNYRGRDAGAQA